MGDNDGNVLVTKRPVAPGSGTLAPAISVRALTKRFASGVVAVDQVSFDIEQGRIVGFVGPNGAGKSTTFGLLLGLIRPTGGAGEVLGHSIDKPRGYLSRVGVVPEQPALYLNMSGLQNLRLLSRQGGFKRPEGRELLERVGLSADPKAKVRTYSLGNRQRMAIAAALLGDPDLLLLDEPGNGLDPAGRRGLERLLRRLADEGKTVLFSSHLLGDVERVADDLLVIDAGRVTYHGPVADLTAKTAQLVVAAEKPADHSAVIKLAAEAGHAASERGGKVWINVDRSFAATLSRQCSEAGITLVELTEQRTELESLFLDMPDD